MKTMMKGPSTIQGKMNMRPLIRQLSNARSRYFLTSSGLNLEYRQKGDPLAEAIVMIHGAGTDCRIFLPNIDPLSEKHQVIAVSLRGHGLSDKPRSLTPEVFAMELLVRDVIELTWSLGIQSFHLVGHGLGALIGYELLERDPGSLLSMVVMAAPATASGLKGALKIMQKTTGLAGKLANHKKKAEMAARMCSGEEQVISYLRDEVFYAANWEILRLLRPLHEGKDYTSLIAETKQVPVVFFQGQDDSVEKNLGSRAAMQATWQALENKEHVHQLVMEGAGYFPNLDQPEQFAKEVLRVVSAV